MNERERPFRAGTPGIQAEAAPAGEKPRFSAKLKPENIVFLIDEIRTTYAPNQPIFYRSDPQFRQILGVSHQTVNDILTIARENGVVAIPYREKRAKVRGGRRAYYFSEEIIKALEYFSRLRRQGEELESTAKRLRAKAKEEATTKLTLSEVANKLGIPQGVLRGWIVEGDVDLKDSLLVEAIKRRNLRPKGRRPVSHHQRLFDLTILEDQQISLLVKRYQERFEDLDSLTLAKFRGNREHFSTLMDVVRLAGLHLKRDRFREVSKILEQAGIEVIRFPHSRSRPQNTYNVLLARDLQKAAETIQNHPDSARFCENPIQLVCGPEIQLPTTYELFYSPNYLSVGNFLRRFGFKVRGSLKAKIAVFFGDESPVSILKYQSSYYFPRDQEPIAREFIKKQKKQLQSSTHANTG